MAPGFYIDNTMAVTDIQWISPTESYSFQRLTSPTSSASYDFDRSDYVSPNSYYTPKKEETVKEILIRQRAAFRVFYGAPQYEVRKSKKECVAQQKEVAGRKEKFKGLNRNLIL